MNPHLSTSTASQLRRAATVSSFSRRGRAPWQSRVFGLCAAIVETCFEGDRESFRQQLIAAIAAEPDRPYWDSWTVALERLVVDEGLLKEFSIERRIG